jgi:DNA-binding IclR family transcriptional regulator
MTDAIAGRPGAELQTVDRSLHLLKLLATEPDAPWTLAGLARETGYGKSQILRMLATLEHHGFATRLSEPGGWTVGDGVLALTASWQVHLLRLALPQLARLTSATGEASLLHVRAGHEAVCVEKVDTSHPIRVAYNVGQRSPLVAGASGKVLLAFQDDRERALLRDGLVGVGGQPLTDAQRDALEVELEAVRRVGWVETRGEVQAKVCAVAAPVLDQAGTLRASVTLVGPDDRWIAETERERREATIAAAARISAALGYRGSAQGDG